MAGSAFNPGNWRRGIAAAGVAVVVAGGAIGAWWTQQVNTSAKCTIVSPSSGGSVSGTTTLQASCGATADVAQFLIDGAAVGVVAHTPNSALYDLSWDSTQVADGSHTVSAIGGGVDSGSVSFTTSNGVGATCTLNNTSGCDSYANAHSSRTITLRPKYNDNGAVYPSDPTGSQNSPTNNGSEVWQCNSPVLNEVPPGVAGTLAQVDAGTADYNISGSGYPVRWIIEAPSVTGGLFYGNGVSLTDGCAGQYTTGSPPNPATALPDLIIEEQGDGATYGQTADALRPGNSLGSDNTGCSSEGTGNCVLNISGQLNCGPNPAGAHQDYMQVIQAQNLGVYGVTAGDYTNGIATCAGGGGAAFFSTHNNVVKGTDLSATNGLTTVTSASGLFTSAIVDEQITINGVVYGIASVTNSTTLDLSTAYSGGTATGLTWSVTGTGNNITIKNYHAVECNTGLHVGSMWQLKTASISNSTFETASGANIDKGSCATMAPENITFTGASSTGGSLAGGTTYYYKITAVEGANETTPGTEASYTVPAGTTTNQITLTWTDESGDNKLSGYRVYRSTTSGAEQLLATITGTANTYTDNTATTPSGSPPTTNDTGSVGDAPLYGGNGQGNTNDVCGSSYPPSVNYPNFTFTSVTAIKANGTTTTLCPWGT